MFKQLATRIRTLEASNPHHEVGVVVAGVAHRLVYIEAVGDQIRYGYSHHGQPLRVHVIPKTLHSLDLTSTPVPEGERRAPVRIGSRGRQMSEQPDPAG